MTAIPPWQDLAPGADPRAGAAALRPRGLAAILDLPFAVLRRHASRLLAVVAVVLAPVALLSSGALVDVATTSVALQQADPTDPTTLAEAERLGGRLLGLTALYTVVVVPVVLVGASRILVADQLGVTLGVRAALLARPGRLVATAATLGLLIAAALAGLAGAMLLVALVAVVAAPLVVLVLPALLAGAGWLIGLAGLAPVVAAVERGGPLRALGRAAQLSAGARWRVGAFGLLVAVVLLLVRNALSGLPAVAQLVLPVEEVLAVVTGAVLLGTELVVLPAGVMMLAALYLDRRVRVEGLDLAVLLAAREAELAAGEAPAAR